MGRVFSVVSVLATLGTGKIRLASSTAAGIRLHDRNRRTNRPFTGEDSMAADTPFGTGSLSPWPDRDAMNATLARHWWAIMLRGVIAVLFGVIALAAPGQVLLSLAFVFGIYLMIDGVIGLVASVRAVAMHGHWGALLAEAVANTLMGMIALLMPGAAVLAFVLLMAAWALISGGLMLAAAMKLHASHGRWWLGLGGVVSVVWGVLLVAAPLEGAVVLTWWLGLYAVVFGIALLTCGWRLHGQHQAG
ncbi:MAG TPA: HdeD family acid-resistance protein [Rhodopila sp.]